jgi:hypothetical protein
MHCPSCGQPATTDQQFCRACGMNLQAISKLVTEHTGSPAELQSKLDRAEREREIVRSMFNWIMWGMIIMGIGVVLVVVNKTYDIGGLFRLLATLVTLSGTGIAAGGVFGAMRKGMNPAPTKRRGQLQSATEPTRLPTNPIPAALPSVTERTTQLIGVAPAEAPIDRRGRE